MEWLRYGSKQRLNIILSKTKAGREMIAKKRQGLSAERALAVKEIFDRLSMIP
jgi:hypothetical protein